MSTETTRGQALRYALVGLANTLITAVVIFSMMYVGLGVFTSNAAGYAAGIVFSFLANSIFTFSKPLSSIRLIKFLTTCGLCWIVNALAIKSFLYFFPAEIYFSQLIGMGFYTISGFFLNKLWVMK